jgi:hypothetical protein
MSETGQQLILLLSESPILADQVLLLHLQTIVLTGVAETILLIIIQSTIVLSTIAQGEASIAVLLGQVGLAEAIQALREGATAKIDQIHRFK